MVVRWRRFAVFCQLVWHKFTGTVTLSLPSDSCVRAFPLAHSWMEPDLVPSPMHLGWWPFWPTTHPVFDPGGSHIWSGRQKKERKRERERLHININWRTHTRKKQYISRNRNIPLTSRMGGNVNGCKTTYHRHWIAHVGHCAGCPDSECPCGIRKR